MKEQQERYYLKKETKLISEIDYWKRDYDGLQEIYNYLSSNGAKQMDIKYIVDEMNEDLRKIEKLKTKLKESQTYSTDSMTEER